MTYFVTRDTNHPQEDLERNFSSFIGGSLNGEEGGATEEEARKNFLDNNGYDYQGEFRFHPAHDCFCAVDYEGLGAMCLDSENIEDAIIEADEYSAENDFAICVEAGDGHFFAKDVVSYKKVREGRFVFEIKC